MKKISILTLFFLFSINVFSQKAIEKLFEKFPEVVFKFQIQDRSQLESLTRMISIDNVQDKEVTAYANRAEFERFLSLNIPYEIVEKPVLTPEELNMMDFEAIKNSRNDWNYYPTYDAYLSMMQQFAADYPDLCEVVDFGQSVQGRKLLACKISKNVSVREAEPQIFWTSTMHGDETTGYVLMLRYIDYLLTNYGVNSRITNILDNMEIWINPLANPDGTYHGGNNTVASAIRYNANYEDLNRNYKNWIAGDHPDGAAWQAETNAFTAMQAGQTFVLGANLHGGVEVCNYPWDITYTRHADDAWWQFVCHEYADTVHLHAPSGYMTYLNNGITNGIDWYIAEGTRQDYANYYNHNREFTLEISSTKNPSASQLPNFWNYNYRSFLNYTEQGLYGIQGTVTNSCGEPLFAKIFIESHDKDNSFVMTDPRVGYYARPIKAGTYNLTYSAEGYLPQTIAVTATDRQKTVQNVILLFAIPPVSAFSANQTEVFSGEEIAFVDYSKNCPISWKWYFEGGTPETDNQQNPTVVYETAGNFSVKLVVENEFGKDSITQENFITVKALPELPVADFEADKTDILIGETVAFTNLSQNAATWEWYFEGGEPEISVEKTPIVAYNAKGTFDVKLVATNIPAVASQKIVANEYSDEMLKVDYIIVSNVGVDEQGKTLSVKVFPNPVQQGSSIAIKSDENIREITLLSLSGISVKSLQVNGTSYLLSTFGVEAGFYLMKIATENKTEVVKVRIQ